MPFKAFSAESYSLGIAGGPVKPARMLPGNRFESELDLQSGDNDISVNAMDPSGNTTSRTFRVNIAQQSQIQFQYDDDGNLLSDGVRSYEWDSLSRLKKITWTAGTWTEFKYNAIGQRAERIEYQNYNETAHHYCIFDGLAPVERRTGPDSATATAATSRRVSNASNPAPGRTTTTAATTSAACAKSSNGTAPLPPDTTSIPMAGAAPSTRRLHTPPAVPATSATPATSPSTAPWRVRANSASRTSAPTTPASPAGSPPTRSGRCSEPTYMPTHGTIPPVSAIPTAFGCRASDWVPSSAAWPTPTREVAANIWRMSGRPSPGMGKGTAENLSFGLYDPCYKNEFWNAGGIIGDTAVTAAQIATGAGVLKAGAEKLIARRAAKISIRTLPKNLAEQLTLHEAKGGAGIRMMKGTIKDPRSSGGHMGKKQHVHKNRNEVLVAAFVFDGEGGRSSDPKHVSPPVGIPRMRDGWLRLTQTRSSAVTERCSRAPILSA